MSENAGAGANVGDPVAAIDLNTSDTLTYSLEDPDSPFAITSQTGQTSVKSGDTLDYETESDYHLRVTATDPGGLTDIIKVKVFITDVNEPPVISGEASPAFNENTGVTTRVARYTARDPEGDSFAWSVGGGDGSDFSIDSNGDLRFNTPPDHETKDEYRITIVATDDGDPPNRGEFPVTVEVANVNEAPTIEGDDTLNYPENTTTSTALGTYTASDPENDDITWPLSGADRGDFTVSENGELSFASSPDYERPADSGRNNEYNVTVRASDGSLTGSLDVTVTVRNVNEAPTAPTGDANITAAENTTGAPDRYSSTDPDHGDTVLWGVFGPDADDFRIDSSGNLAFDGAPDYEMPTDSGGNNVYDIAVVAGDGSLSSSFDVTVTVTPVDEPPVITGDTLFDNRQENDASTIETYTATDPEGDTDINWSLGGPDRGDFTITGGVLEFVNSPDYERPADSGGNNHYDVTIYATDSNNKRGELVVDIIVKNVDEEPVLEGSDTVDDFPENSSTSRQVGRYTATDPELATVTLLLTGTDSDDFTLASNGVLTFKPESTERM